MKKKSQNHSAASPQGGAAAHSDILLPIVFSRNVILLQNTERLYIKILKFHIHLNESVLRGSALWDERWVRFSKGLLARGMVSGKHTFYQAWVRKFLSFLRPKTIFQAGKADVETFLEDLLKEGAGQKSSGDSPKGMIPRAQGCEWNEVT